MTNDERQKLLDHIAESKEIVDKWPAWKREDSRGLSSKRELQCYVHKSVSQLEEPHYDE